MKLDVLQTIGPACMTREDGERLLARFRPAFERGEVVELNFNGVRFFLTHFFNGAISPLLKQHSREELRTRLKLKNVSPTGRQIIKDVVDHAERWFSDAAYRKSVDRVLDLALQEA